MSALTDHLTLADGVLIPSLGFGTWQIPDGAATYDAVAAALAAGYRHIDTARGYGNEASVGRAVADSGIPREQVFITTKLPAEIKEYDAAVESLEQSVASLGVEYVDLYLIHSPRPWGERGTDHSAGNAEVWRAFEDQQDAGRIRAIGVSNFVASELEHLITASRRRPAVNQILFHIGRTQHETVSFCRAHDILVEGYSPLATGSILTDPRIRSIAERYGRSVAQLSIRYVAQKGVLPLPKTTTPARMVENADVDFEISDDDMVYLDGLANTSAGGTDS